MSHKLTPNQVKQDLSSAQSINRANINALQRIFSHKVFNIILKLKLIEEHGNINSRELAQEILKRKLNYFPFRLPRGERYHFRAGDLLDIDAVNIPEDMHGSHKALRAKFCIQSLMFENRKIYKDLCSGVVLENSLGDEEYLENIKVDYNTEYSRIEAAEILAKNVETRENQKDLQKVRENLICSYKNYTLRTNAYIKLKQLRKDSSN